MNKFILEKPYSTNKTFENFALVKAGNKKEVDNSKDIKKKGEFKTNIDRDTVIKASQKIVNNVFNDVNQKNQAEVFNAIAASNSILLNGINCNTLNITNVDQDTDAMADTVAVFIQKSNNKISTDIQTSINKEITNDLPNDTADLMKIQNSAMKDFMDATPGLKKENKKKKLGFFGSLAAAVAAVGGKNEGFALVSGGNTKKINNSYKLDAELKKEFNLSENFTVEDKDEIKNTISTKVNQENFAKCSQTAASNNNITLNDIKCNVANISNIKQKAFARSILTCTFNQQLVSEVATTITNRIDKRISRMSQSAKTQTDKDRIKKFGDAVKERLVNASGLEGAVYKPEQNTSNQGKTNESTKSIDRQVPDSRREKENIEKAVEDAIKRRDRDKEKDTKSDGIVKNLQEEKTDKEEKSTEEEKYESETESIANEVDEEITNNSVTFMGIQMTQLQKNILIGVLIILVILIIILIISMIYKSSSKKPTITSNSANYSNTTSVEAEYLDDSSDSSDM